MSFQHDLDRFYRLLAELEATCRGHRTLGRCGPRDGWPLRGVYFVFDPREWRADGSTLRVVRVGTHAVSAGSRTSLWNRLSQHRGSSDGGGNHRGSVFRRHVGVALLNTREYSPEIRHTWSVGSSAPRTVRQGERALELDVSHYIGELLLLWVEIPDSPGKTSDRGIIEAGSIALLAAARRQGTDPASEAWLGLRSDRSSIRDSGLWNVQHTDAQPSESFLPILERWIGRQRRGIE